MSTFGAPVVPVKPKNPFGVVDQFAAMREGLGSSPLMPQQQLPKPEAGHSEGDGHDHSAERRMGNPTPKGGGRVAGRVRPMFESLESEFGGKLKQTSHYRDQARNRAAGGVPNSWHTKMDDEGYGRAKDYVGSPADMQAGAARARALGAREVLIHNVGSGQHLHVAF